MNNLSQIKSLKYLLAYIMVGMFIFSCQTDEIELEEESFTDYTISSSVLLASDCNTVCIEEGSEVFFPQTDSKTLTTLSNSKSKTVSYSAYNTETMFIVEVLYQINFGSNSVANVTIDIDGNEARFIGITKGTTVTHMIDLPADWQACDEIPFRILQERLSKPIEFVETYSLIGVCEVIEVCDESFSYNTNEDGSYTFSYISDINLDNAEITLTLPHITGYTALDGKSYENKGGKGKAPSNITWTGDIAACDAITFTLQLNPDCDKNNAGFANIFTDFKVNDVSKKGDNTNIRYICNN